ncbi:carboxypeptidase-like regulatory domain-containing protein [Lutibacter sp. A80]|uniref:carboxypeptidase-like regulatory domain-containing protein n=1 Tax=Lutibacter sp. A80 TaxID=2918453 RepID=UPI001F0505EF|nr:carboxypeptidase-like regulatory domain-containing protein [Lutibacter sp. A80]UMB61335.1 carboxypeptidase-like regulatory domain-containing protein [Lutibacter sp. A80]
MKLKIKKYFLVSCFLVLCNINTNAQIKYITFSGVIFDSTNTLSDVHVVNLNNKMGTISSNTGTFKITASVGDILLISSIQYEPLKIKITKEHALTKNLSILLEQNINKLDEVFLNGLTGDLSFDLANKPKETLPKHSFSFDRSQVNKLGADYATDFSKAPDARRLTDPTAAGGGVGTGFSLPDKRLEAEKKLKRELKNDLKFPDKLKRKFGTSFFVNDLKIPEDKIYNFINYCENRNIIKKFNENKLFEIIKILQEQSILYNEIEK